MTRLSRSTRYVYSVHTLRDSISLWYSNLLLILESCCGVRFQLRRWTSADRLIVFHYSLSVAGQLIQVSIEHEVVTVVLGQLLSQPINLKKNLLGIVLDILSRLNYDCSILLDRLGSVAITVSG